MGGLEGQKQEGLTASHCHSFHHQGRYPQPHPHLTPAGRLTGSAATLPGEGRSLRGQHSARALQKTPSWSACSRCSESSSHRKAPAPSFCPGQGSWSRNTKTSQGQAHTACQALCQTCGGHSLPTTGLQGVCHHPHQQWWLREEKGPARSFSASKR